MMSVGVQKDSHFHVKVLCVGSLHLWKCTFAWEVHFVKKCTSAEHGPNPERYGRTETEHGIRVQASFSLFLYQAPTTRFGIENETH